MNYKEAIAKSNQGIAIKVIEGFTYSVDFNENIKEIDWKNKKVNYPIFSSWKEWQDWKPEDINF